MTRRRSSVRVQSAPSAASGIAARPVRPVSGDTASARVLASATSVPYPGARVRPSLSRRSAGSRPAAQGCSTGRVGISGGRACLRPRARAAPAAVIKTSGSVQRAPARLRLRVRQFEGQHEHGPVTGFGHPAAEPGCVSAPTVEAIKAHAVEERPAFSCHSGRKGWAACGGRDDQDAEPGHRKHPRPRAPD